MSSDGLPPEAYAAALATRPGVGGRGLVELLAQREPREAWARSGGMPDDVAAGWVALSAAGVAVHVLGRPGYPPALADDPDPPAVLFSRGDVGALNQRRVAIVGSRNCTRYGRDVAYELGRDLAEAGVAVVSGLALGVDGAAHAGALGARGGAADAAGRTIGVVGSGLDVVYPRRHARLWDQVAAVGVLLSEAPLGAAPEPWRFPLRNRIIAALAEVVVVVESLHTGGSRHTVEAALARDRAVMAVPGPVRSPTSDLPNGLLAEGCAPARDALDVLVALGLSSSSARSAASAAPADNRPTPERAAASVLDALGWQPASFEQVVLATGRPAGEVSVLLAHLEQGGWVVGSGGWWERVSIR